MPSKADLLSKLFSDKVPRNFTLRELDRLMHMCDCLKMQGGRGSGIMYVYKRTKQSVSFDSPHPQKELYIYQVKKVRNFIINIGERIEE